MTQWRVVLLALAGAGVAAWLWLRRTAVPVDRGHQKERHGRTDYTGPSQA